MTKIIQFIKSFLRFGITSDSANALRVSIPATDPAEITELVSGWHSLALLIHDDNNVESAGFHLHSLGGCFRLGESWSKVKCIYYSINKIFNYCNN